MTYEQGRFPRVALTMKEKGIFCIPEPQAPQKAPETGDLYSPSVPP
jgi:hypothetical protein